MRNAEYLHCLFNFSSVMKRMRVVRHSVSNGYSILQNIADRLLYKNKNPKFITMGSCFCDPALHYFAI